MKKIIRFVLILGMWLLGGLIFKVDIEYYNMLSLPSFVLPKFLISIVWFILYILISISIYKISENTN